MAPSLVHAEERRVALLPFWGDNAEVQWQFGSAVFTAMSEMEGFEPVEVDMENRSADVPEGGFPPHVAPHPSLTHDAPFGITGNVTFNSGTDQWDLFLYLWQLDVVPQRLLWGDMSSFDDPEGSEFILTFVLEFLFSWIPGEDEDVVAEEEPELVGRLVAAGGGARMWGGEWFYAGLRLGWNQRLFEPLWQDRNMYDIESSWRNVLAALSLNVQFAGFLGAQIEALFAYDFGVSPSDADISSLTIPFMLRYTFHMTGGFASVMAGVFAFFPFDTGPDSPFRANDGLRWGYTAGLRLGTLVGHGSLFADLRWSHDMFSFVAVDHFRRSTIGVSVGYEIGFIERSRGR